MWDNDKNFGTNVDIATAEGRKGKQSSIIWKALIVLLLGGGLVIRKQAAAIEIIKIFSQKLVPNLKNVNFGSFFSSNFALILTG